MKSKLVIMTLCCTILGGTAVAQTEKPVTHVMSLITLDNYTIPINQKGVVVGKVLSANNKKQSKISIVKDTAGIFRINSKGVISLKKKVELSSISPAFIYGITIKRDGQKKYIELVKDEFIKNAVVSHRGAWKKNDYSQNSLSSLKNAIAIGSCASELDVWLSQDGEIVVCHDPTVGGKVLEQTTAAELTKIPLKNNDFVPTLKEYLQTVKTQNKTRLFLEIKASLVSHDRTLELTEKVVNMVHDLKAQAWVNYISFDFGSLVRVMELDPTAKTAYVSDDKTIKEIADAKMWSADFNGKMFQTDPTLIKQAHDRGLVVNVWTINDAEQMKQFLNAGVDVITTNEPEILLELLKQK